MPKENGEDLNKETPANVQDVVANVPENNGVEGEGTTPASEQPETKKWMSQLPDKLKGNENLSKYESLGEALESLLDGSTSKTEGDGDGEQEGKKPAVEYNFSKDLTDNDDPNGVIRSSIKDAISEMELPAENADKVYSNFVDTFNGMEEKVRKGASEKCESSLHESWGDKYDENLASMKRAYTALVPEGSELEIGLKSTLAESNPYVVDLLSKVGQSISEHTPPRSTAVGEEKRNSGFLNRENETYPWVN